MDFGPIPHAYLSNDKSQEKVVNRSYSPLKDIDQLKHLPHKGLLYNCQRMTIYVRHFQYLSKLLPNHHFFLPN